MHDTSFRSMGCDVRLLIAGGDDAADAAAREREYVEAYAARLTRFDPDSELSRLNDDPRAEVPASPLLRIAIAAGLWAAERSGGLVDPTITTALERAGYDRSREGAVRAPLAEALADAPPRRPAKPSPAQAWRRVKIDHARGTIARPPGLKLDTGGTGKGLAADAVATRLLKRGHTRFAIDCGGDIALAGEWEIAVRHPLTGEVAHTVAIANGGIATSGIDSRVWRKPDGAYAHHLIDPSTGEPAWTGLISATATAQTALEAETRAKQALLSGPAGAAEAVHVVEDIPAPTTLRIAA
jgi:thiamine biosynthesis lipoprotein